MTPRFTHRLGAGLLALTALTTSCAGSYAPIRPQHIATFTSSPTAGPVDMGYQYDVLHLGGGNKKYVKKEIKRGYHVAAVRVTNNWDREVNFSRDLVLQSGERPAIPVPATAAAHDLGQGVAIYLLYALLNFQVGATRDVRTGATTGGTFIPTGPFIALGNILGASLANGNMRKEFETFDLTNRTIKPGETVYGIVTMREVAPLRLVLRTDAALAAPATAMPAAPASTPPAGVVPAAGTAPAPASTPAPPSTPR